MIRKWSALCLGLPNGQKEASLRILLICIGLAWAATVLLVSLAEKQQEAALERLSSYKLKPRPVLLDRAVPALTADAELADALHATAVGNAAGGSADVAAASVTGTATDTTAASDEPASIVEAALTDSSQMLPPETPPVQVATASTAGVIPKDTRDAVSSIEILGECLVADICIDRYLWALYQRTPKEDSIKVDEQRKVTVKRKGKTVTVTETFTKLVDEDFAWKDPKAAEKAGMPMMDYVIGGMDRSFKTKLFHALHAAEEAGLVPGITSAFRDDYRWQAA